MTNPHHQQRLAADRLAISRTAMPANDVRKFPEPHASLFDHLVGAASSVSGAVRPSALAAFRLITRTLIHRDRCARYF